MSSIDGDITVFGKEDKVGDGAMDWKFSCSSIRKQLHYMVAACYTLDKPFINV